MRNHELYEEIKELRKEAQAERNDMRQDINDLKLELSIFKGKSFGFMACLSLVFTLITNIGLAYITKGK